MASRFDNGVLLRVPPVVAPQTPVIGSFADVRRDPRAIAVAGEVLATERRGNAPVNGYCPNKPIMGWDLDGALAGTFRLAFPDINREFGTDLRYKDFTRYTFHKCIEGSDPAVINRIIDDIWEFRWHEIPLEFKDARIVMDALAEHYQHHITTAAAAKRGKVARENVLKWLDMHELPFDDVYHVDSSKEKAGLGHVDVFYDDDATFARNVARDGRHMLLSSQPWNKKFRRRVRKGKVEVRGKIIPVTWDNLQENAVALAAEIRS